MAELDTGDVGELNDMLINIGRMIGELDTATTITTGSPAQVKLEPSPVTGFTEGQAASSVTDAAAIVPYKDEIRLDSLEADTDDLDFNDTDSLIPAVPKESEFQIQTCSSNQLRSSSGNHHLPSPSPAPVSELKLKPSKVAVSTKFTTHGSKVQGELVVGLDLQGTFVVKTESEAGNADKPDLTSSASTEKVSVRVFNEDKSSVKFSISNELCARDVCHKMVMLNSVKLDPNYVIVEHLTDLALERSVEDHENVLEVYKTWSPHSNNYFIFRKDPKKYDFFLHTANYFPPHLLDAESGSDKAVTERAQKAKRILLQNLLSTCSRAPELEGHLQCKEFHKKSWSKKFFILRGSGLYCSTKGKSKASTDLQCYVQFEGSNLYHMMNVKKSHKSPTEFCFAIVPLRAKDFKELKCFCVEDEKTFLSWTMAVRMAKYGVQLRHNHDDMLRKLKKLAHLDGSSRKMQRRMTVENRPLVPPTPLPEPDSSVESEGRVAMDFTGHHGKVITNSKEAAAVAGTRPRVKISQRMASNLCCPAQPEISGSKYADQPWFHGRIAREQSLRLLIKEGLENGMFLIRESCSVAGVFVLTFCMNKKVYHCQLVEDVGPGNTMYIGLANGLSFPSILDFIDHYQEKPLNNVSLALRRHCPKHEPHGTM